MAPALASALHIVVVVAPVPVRISMTYGEGVHMPAAREQRHHTNHHSFHLCDGDDARHAVGVAYENGVVAHIPGVNDLRNWASWTKLAQSSVQVALLCPSWRW